MPLLDISTAQLSLQNSLVPVFPQSFFHGQVLLGPWKISQFHRRLKFTPWDLEKRGSRLKIRAVATIELKPLVCSENDRNRSDLETSLSTDVELKESWVDLDEREKLRRMRISKANKGGTPWNKGRKHSDETRRRIRERTKIAMQDPKIRMKLINLGHAQSKETRSKIGVGLRMRWERRRRMQKSQDICYFEWQNFVAEASRKGFFGEDELQWDSYEVLDEQLKREWAETLEQRKTMPRPRSSKRAPKSPEQRKKIAAAIAAKWADPEYRERVCSGLAKYHGTTDGVESKPKKRASGSPQSRSTTRKKSSDVGGSPSIETKTPIELIRSRRCNAPLYKDPMASSKLRMLKKIRAERALAESKKTGAIEQARVLIAEAEKAANALEIAAGANPVARASLLETRKLIAEAIQTIESIQRTDITSNENVSHLSVQSTELPNEVNKGMGSENGGTIQPDQKAVNGNQTISIGKNQDFGFPNFTLPRMVNGEARFTLSSSSYDVSSALNLEDLIKLPDSTNQLDQLQPNGISKSKKINGANLEVKEDDISSKPVAVTKKWVRGRLVEVTEETSESIDPS